jgi:hypothetical protein
LALLKISSDCVVLKAVAEVIGLTQIDFCSRLLTERVTIFSYREVLWHVSTF